MVLSVISPSQVVRPGSVDELVAAILGTQTASLLGYYQCNDTPGNLADSSSHKRTAIVGGSPTYGVEGQRGNAVQFAAGSDVAMYKDASALLTDNVDGFTFAALVNPTDAAGDYMFCGLGWLGSTVMKNYAGMYARPADAPKWRISWSDSGGAVAVGTVNATYFTVGTWQFVAARFASAAAGGNGKATFTRNKVHTEYPTNLETTYGFTGVSSDALCIGCLAAKSTLAWQSKCKIQHAAFWKTVLTDGQLDAIYDIAFA